MRGHILIAGGSHADIPIIFAAKKAGYKVITSGNNAKDLGHIHSDLYVPADYSDPDAILKIAKDHDIEAIVASANDFSAISCSYVAQQLKLPGHDPVETTKTLHHKDRFRALAQQLKLNIPNAIRITKSEAERIKDLPLVLPVIVKPVDLSGGKGMTKVNTLDQLRGALQKAFSATQKEYIVIEEYIQGSNHGYSTFLLDGKIVFAFMDDEHYFLNHYLVSGASTSLSYSKTLANKLNQQLEILAGELNLVDGLLHVQFILHNNEPYIIEICRRTPGDLYVKLVEYATDFPMSNAMIKFVTGTTPENFSIKQINWITRHCAMSKQNGTICNLEYGIFKQMIIDKMTFYKPGDKINNYLTYKAEIDFIQYKNKKEMEALHQKLTNEITIRLCK